MNVRFLETLVWLARLKSYRRTAEHLFTTQAAISQRVAALESQLGERLIERGSRKFRLTPAGEQALAFAERVTGLVADLRAAMSPRAPPSGVVRLGVIESVVHTWAPALIHRVSEHAPRLELALTVDTALNLRNMFTAGALDIVVQNDAFEEGRPDRLQHRPLCRFPIRWIASPKLVPRRRRLSEADLGSKPLLTFSRTSSPRRHLQELFQHRSDVRINSLPSVAAIIRLAVEGYGIAAIPPLFVQRELSARELQLFEGPPLPDMNVTATTRPGEGRAILTTLEHIEATVRNYCTNAGRRWAIVVDR
jgi:DNA-binding transcriptional LysR family regulator